MLCAKEECCGCSACIAACPKQCISMQTDETGFAIPLINELACIQCGACEKACPVLSEVAACGDFDRKAYAAICREQDGEIRHQSSSGGLFWCLAQAILASGGIVAGVKLSEDGQVAYHTLIQSQNDLKALMGSKYVQSDKRGVFKEIRELLQEGKTVLFSGTPCEVSGLLSYLPTSLQENLYTIDLICHGVPSPLVWKKYLMEQRIAVKEVSFRDKTFGWKNFSLRVQSEEKSQCEKVGDNLYMRGFLEHLYLRKSCYNCRFKGLLHSADITLGDFWKVSEFLPEYDDNMGTSLIFTHSQKGGKLFEYVKSIYRIDSCEVDAKLASESNPMMLYSSKPHKNAEKFFREFYKKTVAKNVKVCTQKNIFYRFAKKAKRLLLRLLEGDK